MRILMLGWEFAPEISGGLGVACEGLSRALTRLGHDVTYVMPRAERRMAGEVAQSGRKSPTVEPSGGGRLALQRIEAPVASPYGDFRLPVADESRTLQLLLGDEAGPGLDFARTVGFPVPVDFGEDVLASVDRFTAKVRAFAAGERGGFDVIHAHDWVTYPAAIAVARDSGRPFIAHVHSTEFDRAGEQVNQAICDIEARGLHAADRVIAVSDLTRQICVRQYGVSPAKVDVIYNGIDRADLQPQPGARIEARDKIVLFLGRVTQQKGPEQFIAAAARVLERYRDVVFVIAGSGDLATAMMDLAAAKGLGGRVLFTGFLTRPNVERIFQMADCYVMPSMSEPFGLAALEAIHHGVPTIISRQSGAAEVLGHVLKVDFGDTEDLASKILAVLRHPALGQTLREHAPLELQWLTWDAAAERCLASYGRVGVAGARGGCTARGQ